MKLNLVTYSINTGNIMMMPHRVWCIAQRFGFDSA